MIIHLINHFQKHFIHFLKQIDFKIIQTNYILIKFIIKLLLLIIEHFQLVLVKDVIFHRIKKIFLVQVHIIMII